MCACGAVAFKIFLQRGMLNKGDLLHGFLDYVGHIEEVDPVTQKSIYRNFVGGIHYCGQVAPFVERLHGQREIAEGAQVGFFESEGIVFSKVEPGKFIRNPCLRIQMIKIL